MAGTSALPPHRRAVWNTLWVGTHLEKRPVALGRNLNRGPERLPGSSSSCTQAGQAYRGSGGLPIAVSWTGGVLQPEGLGLRHSFCTLQESTGRSSSPCMLCNTWGPGPGAACAQHASCAALSACQQKIKQALRLVQHLSSGQGYKAEFPCNHPDSAKHIPRLRPTRHFAACLLLDWRPGHRALPVSGWGL